MDSLVQGPRDGLDVTVTNVTGEWGVLVLAGRARAGCSRS